MVFPAAFVKRVSIKGLRLTNLNSPAGANPPGDGLWQPPAHARFQFDQANTANCYQSGKEGMKALLTSEMFRLVMRQAGNHILRLTVLVEIVFLIMAGFRCLQHSYRWFPCQMGSDVR